MSQESNDSVCRELDRAYEQHKAELVASHANQATEAGQLLNAFRDSLRGAIRLTLDLGLATGHAETYEELYTEVRSQIEEYRNIHIALMNVMQEVDAVGSVSVGAAEAARAALTEARGSLAP